MRRLALALLLLSPLAAKAQTPNLLVTALGGTDLVRGTRAAADLRFEYRPGLALLRLMDTLTLRPWVGGEVTTRGSLWGGGGLLLDIPFGRFNLVPMAGAGLYSRGGGRDLGSALEFRTGIEAAYRFANETRTALTFTHTSNAGITRRNPGTEAVVFSVQFPLTR